MMVGVYAFLFILNAAHVLCRRGNIGLRGNAFVAFMLPSKETSTHRKEQHRSVTASAEPLSSSHEPLPYSSGYVPTIVPGDLKYMGQPIEGEFKPANNFVLILKNEMHHYSEGGVYIGAKSNKEFVGKILAIGPGKYASLTGKQIPMTVKVGDIVLYEPPEEKPVITYKNKECVLVPEDHIYARVELESSTPRPLEAPNIKPISDRILVRIIDSPKKTQSGLVLAQTDNALGSIFRAVVLSVGPGRHREDGTLVPNDEVKEGDTILFSDIAADGGEFSLSKTQHAFVRPNAILAKL